jgi:zinc and cadmium transporter
VLTNTFMVVMLASLTACAVTTVGIIVISRYQSWAMAKSIYFKSFAAGVLIAVSFLHLVPKSVHMNEVAPAFLLVGFLAIYLSNRFLKLYACQESECPRYVFGLVPMMGIGLHSFIDGVIHAVTFNVSVFTGVLAAVGMVLHEFPEGVVTFVFLKEGGFERRKAILLAFLAAALSTPVGALVAYPFVSRVEKPILGNLLALSAGALVYVGASHLLPEVEKESRRYTLVALVAGMAVAVAIVLTRH